MFEKKAVVEPDYNSMFGIEIVKSLERIEDLNDEDRKATREIELKTLEWDTDITQVKRDLKLMKGELAVSKANVTEIKARFTGIVNELRICATSEDMDRLKRRLDTFDFETFMTRADFMQLISRR